MQEAFGNGSYRYRVRAVNASGSSDWRTGGVDCAVLIPPAVPASITYPATSSTGLYDVSWAAATGAVSYELERSANAGGTWAQGNGSYRYRVRAVNASGSSDWRTGGVDCAVLIPPAIPASITYPAVSSTGLYDVSWAATTGAVSYELERSEDAGGTWTQVYSAANTTYARFRRRSRIQRSLRQASTM